MFVIGAISYVLVYKILVRRGRVVTVCLNLQSQISTDPPSSV